MKVVFALVLYFILAGFIIHCIYTYTKNRKARKFYKMLVSKGIQDLDTSEKITEAFDIYYKKNFDKAISLSVDISTLDYEFRDDWGQWRDLSYMYNLMLKGKHLHGYSPENPPESVRSAYIKSPVSADHKAANRESREKIALEYRQYSDEQLIAMSHSDLFGKTKAEKPASVVKRAAAGGIIAGPVGAVVGAISAVDKNNREKKK